MILVEAVVVIVVAIVVVEVTVVAVVIIVVVEVVVVIIVLIEVLGEVESSRLVVALVSSFKYLKKSIFAYLILTTLFQGCTVHVCKKQAGLHHTSRGSYARQ